MRVTLLGHASVLVELGTATCLMDPVLGDPFEEGTVVSCPRRTVRADRLPRVDLLVVSHRHPDHLDLASLAQVNRDADVICPPDPVILYALEQLGFAHVHPVHPMAPIVGDDFELYPTRSEVRSIAEMGMVFRDASGVFWNQVDSELSDETIGSVRTHVGAVDVLFAMYASQNFEFFESRATTFPTRTHERNLQTLAAIGPRVAVPASAGFRFCGEHAWLNAFLFPISRQRFVTDAAEVASGIATELVNPGDIVEIGPGGVGVHREGSEIVVTDTDDSQRIAFDPTAPVPPLVDRNTDGFLPAELTRAVDELVRQGLGGFVCAGPADDLVRAAYREQRARYRVGVVFPNDDDEHWWAFDFGAQPPRVIAGQGEAPEADLVHRITASALIAWARHHRSFFSVRNWSRRFGVVCRPAADAGPVRLAPVTLPDLLMYYVLRIADGSETAAKQELDHQLRTLRTGGGAPVLHSGRDAP
jgi:UDP-MurNAc hydroxylase